MKTTKGLTPQIHTWILSMALAFPAIFAWPLHAQTTSTWSLAGDGNWADTANWSTTDYPNNGQPLPGDTYNAILDTNRTITLDQDITIQGFTQSTGAVTGAAARTFTLEDTFSWTGGTLGGGMTVQANGGVSVTNNVNHDLSGGTIFNNAGVMNWGGGGIGNSANTWTFNNTVSGVINVNSTSGILAFGALSGGKTINNAGTINVATATFSNYLDFQSPTNNSGLIDVTGSYIILRGGTNTGQIQVAAGHTVQFSSSGFTQNGSGSLTGAGHVQVVGVSGGEQITFSAGTTYDVGSTLIHSGDMIFNNTAKTGNLTLTNIGRLMGSGTLTANGVFTWTGNGGFPNYFTGIFGSLEVRAEGGMLMNGITKVIVEGGTINNFGAAQWTSGDLSFKPTGGGATTRFINNVGGTLDLQFDGSIVAGGVASSNLFSNAGNFTKSGGVGTSLFNTVTSNTANGTMEVNSGTLSIWTLTNQGSITVGSGATLTFHDHTTSTGGAYTQTSGSLILDGGSVVKTGNALAINGGSIGGSGTITGNVSMTAASLNPGNSPGALNIAGDLSVTADTIWNFEIGGTTQGSEYDFVIEAGSLAFNVNNSTLQLSLINSFTPTALDTFTIFSSNAGILGTFSNLDSFDRVHFAQGSFHVGISGNNITLSDFEVIPEPGTAGLLVVAALLSGLLHRRRRRVLS